MKLLTEEEEEVAATSRDWSDRSKYTFLKILLFNKIISQVILVSLPNSIYVQFMSAADEVCV